VTTDDAAGPPEHSTLIVVGYVSAILMPIVGLIIGLTQLRRGGGGIVIAAILSFVFWLAAILAVGWVMAP
jgi:hypothetical protein